MTGSRANSDVSEKDENLKWIPNKAPLKGIYPAPIDRLGPPGRWVRHKLLHAILSGVPVLTACQRLHRPWLDHVMKVCSFLGTEDFYTGIIVLLTWVIDSRLGRLFTILMSLGFYCTTFGKNILRLPRPPSPPVKVLEATHDWSFPSLHSFIGVALPWYICIYIITHYSLAESTHLILIAAISFWSLSVSISRVYLGVHSVADIIAGVIPGVILLLCYLCIDDAVDNLLLHSQYTTLMAFAFYAFILFIHPSSGPPTFSYGETVITSSVAFGMIVAFERTRGSDHWFYSALLENQEGPLLTPFQLVWMSIARIGLGFPLVLLTRVILKATLKRPLFRICHYLGIPAYSYSDYRKTVIQLSKHYTPDYKMPPIYPKEKVEDEATPNGNGVSHNGNGTCHQGNGVSHHSNGTSHYSNGVVNNSSKMNGNGTATNGASTSNGSSHSEHKGLAWSMNGLTPYSEPPLDVDTPMRFITYTCMTWLAAEFAPYLFYHTGLNAHVS